MKGYINAKRAIEPLAKALKLEGKNVQDHFLSDYARFEKLGIRVNSLELQNDPIVNMYVRMLNYSETQRVAFFNAFVAGFASARGTSEGAATGFVQELFKDKPVIITDPKDSKNVLVFVNTMYSYNPYGKIHHLKADAFIDSIGNWYKQYHADKADERKRAAWATTARGLKRLKRYESMPITRVVERFFGYDLKAIGFSAAVIRDIGTALQSELQPPEIIYVDTDPHGYFDMFKDGPESCMRDNGSREFSFMSKLRLHPTSFFAHIDGVQGAYLKAGNKVVARAFLYDGDKLLAYNNGTVKQAKGRKFYGRVYSSTPKHGDTFIRGLLAAGYISSRDNGWTHFHPKSGKANIPVYKNASNADNGPSEFVPTPYCDDFIPRCIVEYDEDTNSVQLIFEDNAHGTALSLQNQRGYTPVSQLKTSKCAICGDVLHPDTPRVEGRDGKTMHEVCAMAAGYRQVRTVSGGTVFANVHDQDVLRDTVNGDYYLVSAMQKYAMLPFLPSLMDSGRETNMYTRTGTVVKIHDKFYRMLPDAVRTLSRAAGVQRGEFVIGTGSNATRVTALVLPDKAHLQRQEVSSVTIDPGFTPFSRINSRELMAASAA